MRYFLTKPYQCFGHLIDNINAFLVVAKIFNAFKIQGDF